MSQPYDPNGQKPQSTGYTAYDPVTGQPLSQPIPSAQTYDPSTGQPYPPQAYGQQQPYGQQSYGQPAYQGYPPAGYGYAAPVPPPKRPGTAVAIAVLEFVQSFGVLCAGIALLAGADIVRTASSYSRTGIGGSVPVEFTVLAVVTIVAGALLIAGGVTVLSNKLPMTYAGCVLSLAISAYWIIRPMTAGADEFGSLFGVVLLWSVLPIIALALTPSVNKWVRQRHGAV